MSALKSNMVTISMETNRGKKIYFYFFSIFFHTDHNKCTMKWLGWKMSKIVFRPAPPPPLKYCGIIGLLLNIPISIFITIWVLGLSLQLKFENKNYKSNILTVFRIKSYIRCFIKIAMLHLVCMSISRLFNDFITNQQQLRNLSRTSFSDGTQ